MTKLASFPDTWTETALKSACNLTSAEKAAVTFEGKDLLAQNAKRKSTKVGLMIFTFCHYLFQFDLFVLPSIYLYHFI